MRARKRESESERGCETETGRAGVCGRWAAKGEGVRTIRPLARLLALALSLPPSLSPSRSLAGIEGCLQVFIVLRLLPTTAEVAGRLLASRSLPRLCSIAPSRSRSLYIPGNASPSHQFHLNGRRGALF